MMRAQLKDALLRAVKTFAQTALSLLTVNVVAGDVVGVNVLTVDWWGVLSVSVGAALLSLLGSLGTLRADTPPTVAVDDVPPTDRLPIITGTRRTGRHHKREA